MDQNINVNSPITDEVMQLFITEVRSKLNSNLAEINITEAQSDIFSWYNTGVTFLFIMSGSQELFTETPALIIVPYLNGQDVDDYKYCDLRDISSNIRYKLLDSLTDQISFLLDAVITQNSILPKNVIYDLSFVRFNSPETYANFWFAYEFRKASSEIISKPILKSLPEFNSEIFHQTTYRFNDVINGLQSPQFSAELDEVLFSYNHAKWFVAASGCGGLLEHMYALVVQNYSNINSLVAAHNTSNPDSKIPKVQKLPGSATAQDYITAMNQIYNTLSDLAVDDKQVLKFDTRQKTRAQTTFQIRNSVSHYNSGLTCKEDVERMLLELKDTYDAFYVPSKLFKENH